MTQPIAATASPVTQAASTTEPNADAPSETAPERAVATGEPVTQTGPTAAAPAAQPFAVRSPHANVARRSRVGGRALRIIDAAAPSGGGSSNTGLGLVVALIGAGGIALLRARTLTHRRPASMSGRSPALGQSAATTFWAGSCYSFGSSGSMTTSLAQERISAVRIHGDRARFDVGGVASARASDTAPALPTTSVSHGAASSDDRTMLVAVLLAASAMIGGLFAAVSPYRPKPESKTR